MMAATAHPLRERIIRITLCGLAGGMLLSFPMWGIGERSFPCLPIFGSAFEPSGLLHPALFGALMALVIGGIVRPGKVFLLPLVGLLLLLCLIDLNRLQPWTWLYVLVFSMALVHKNDHPESFRWLLGAVYFWSGVNKLTPYYAEDNFPWFCEAFSATRFLGQYPVLGYATALFETGLGLLLLWPRAPRQLRWLPVLFHGLIVVILLKARWNYVVIPWNIAMAAIAFVSWTRAEKPTTRFNTASKILLSIIWLTPLAGRLHVWPYQLSWHMYANTQPEPEFYSTTPCPKTGVVWAEKSFDHGRRLMFDDWALTSLRVPMFYSDHTFRQLGRYLCDCSVDTDSSHLEILRVHPWNKAAEHRQVIPCRELKSR